MTQHRPGRATLAPLLVATFVALLVRAPEASAFERQRIACDLEDLTRTISLRVDPHAGYVCDVLYEKPDEGGTREVLWSARNNVDYCKPRFDDMVKDLAERGWICDYVEEPDDAGDQPAIGAAQDERRDDDEAASEGPEGAFRDRCIADAASEDGVHGGGSIKSYCDCVVDGMNAEGLTEGDARLVFDGLAALSGEESAGVDKRLNTLSANYESTVESCL